jgi:holo-[acyl-carrier protein] synthase
MIFGIGTDIVRMERIESALARHGERFMEKILGTEEQSVYRHRKVLSPARGLRFLATRFAAKEAFSKALGSGMRVPMCWHAVQILNDASGRPIPVIAGDLQNFMLENTLHAQVSITDELDYAVAFVILEKR